MKITPVEGQKIPEGAEWSDDGGKIWTANTLATWEGMTDA